MMQSSLSQHTWQQTQPVINRICQHPFITAGYFIPKTVQPRIRQYPF